ncbi:MAG: transcriptional regulator [Candidatus Schekmanbacteria bacterium]|nr:transcriptional regulator [Candidatus Schekmanbacteria bacterium]
MSDEEERRTRRQELTDYLRHGPTPLRELAAAIKAGLRETVEELEHVARSLRPERINIQAASCQTCDFVFRERRRFTTPSRCPLCKSQRINEPLFWLE